MIFKKSGYMRRLQLQTIKQLLNYHHSIEQISINITVKKDHNHVFFCSFSHWFLI